MVHIIIALNKNKNLLLIVIYNNSKYFLIHSWY